MDLTMAMAGGVFLGMSLFAFARRMFHTGLPPEQHQTELLERIAAALEGGKTIPPEPLKESTQG